MNKKFVILFLFFFLGVYSVNSKDIVLEECEYTDQYKEWLTMSSKEKEEHVEPIKCKMDSVSFAKIGSTSEAISDYNLGAFDLRNFNYVTSVKNQQNSGSCWAFATAASIESNMLVNGQGNYDLSEAHMELSTQNSLFESYLPFNRTFSRDGNYFVSMSYLFNRIGPVIESDVPYSLVVDSLNAINNTTDGKATIDDIIDKNVILSVNSTTNITNQQGSCTSDAIVAIKKYLTTYGAIGAQIYFEDLTQEFAMNGLDIDDTFVNGPYYYYNGATYIDMTTTTIDANQNVNHAVTIVGWDDSIAVDKFGLTPSRTGAWIVKNSHGENTSSVNVGDNGYYYVSYDDINICTGLVGFNNIDTDVEDNAYFNDELGITSYYSVAGSLYYANFFAKSSQNVEELKKVSFYSGINQNYELYYINGDANNFSNKQLIKSGVVTGDGYVTINLENIKLTSNEFGIVVKLSPIEGNDSTSIGLYVPDNSSTYYSNFETDINNASYISVDGTTIQKLYPAGTDKYSIASIKAYTNNLEYSLSSNEEIINENGLVVKYNYENIIDKNNIMYNVYKTSDNRELTSVNDNFTIVNGIATNKEIQVAPRDTSEDGNYYLKVFYDDAIIITYFDITTENGIKKISLYKPKTSDDNIGNDNIIIANNPNNKITSAKDEDVSNPKTGEYSVIFLFVVLLTTFLSTLIIYKNRKKKNII